MYAPGYPVTGPVKKEHHGFVHSIKETLGITHEQREAKRQLYVQECQFEENRRWPTPQIRQIAERYQTYVGIRHIALEYRKDYLDHLRLGYFEPIPLVWSTDNRNPLTGPSWDRNYEDEGERRLYWVLNHSHWDGKPRFSTMRPNEEAEIRNAHLRKLRGKSIKLEYASQGDFFRSNPRYTQLGYTRQVPAPPVHPQFMQVQRQANEGLVEVDTMVLLDVSSSMGWTHQGLDQPRHVDVVHNILQRAISHMELRDRFPNMGGPGVQTFMFNTQGYEVGKIRRDNFEQMWTTIRNAVFSGGGTQVMSGWNLVKNAHFNRHGGEGKSWWDPTFGWQATPAMTKLSLLVMLDGEASDMDEFELELLGENWAYVTILLIGQENCPHHHRHANELERISKANDHIQFLDCHGRICERMVVDEVLQRVYACNAPGREEILDPRFDLPPPPYTPY